MGWWVIIGNRKKIDWNAIRVEYMGGGISQRKLAEKHGVKYALVRDRSISEGWVKQRKDALSKSIAEAEQKIADAVADNATIATDLKRSLLMRLKRIEEKFPADATEVRTKDGGFVTVYRIKDLTAAYRDLTGDIVKVSAQDTEDLSPLVELLRNE